MKDINSLEQVKVKATKTLRGPEDEKTLRHSGLFSMEKRKSETDKAGSSLQAAKEKNPAGFKSPYLFLYFTHLECDQTTK